jgi:hypothetical protein
VWWSWGVVGAVPGGRLGRCLNVVAVACLLGFLLVAVGRFQTRTSTTYRTYNIEDFLIFHFGLIIPHSRIKHYSRINRSFSFSNFIPITASKREKWRQTCPMKKIKAKSTHQIKIAASNNIAQDTRPREEDRNEPEPSR